MHAIDCVKRLFQSFWCLGYLLPSAPNDRLFWAGGKKTSPEVKKGIMTRKIENPAIFINHWRWLEANGYKRQAASCKRQAASLTRKQYRSIKDYEKDKKQAQ
jgi:hypothetical protein